MYLIVVYDVSGRRVTRVHKYLKTKITWIQNSVFEGEVLESEYVKIKTKLKKIMNKKTDSIVIYCFDSKKYTKREMLGIKKNEISNVL